MHDDDRREWPWAFGQPSVHPEFGPGWARVDYVLPESAFIAPQPGDQFFFPQPLVGMPVFKVVNGPWDANEAAIRQLLAEILGFGYGRFIVLRAMEHEDGNGWSGW